MTMRTAVSLISVGVLPSSEDRVGTGDGVRDACVICALVDVLLNGTGYKK